MENPTRRNARQVETYRKIECAIGFIQSRRTEKVTLADAAAAVNLSEYHFHRLFVEWAGTTPERFFKYLKKEYLIRRLDETSLIEATYRAGLSNPSRLHDLFVTYEAMSPGEYRRRGAGLKIRYGVHASPCGIVFIAGTDRGIVTLRFLESPKEAEEHVESLRLEFPDAEIKIDPVQTEQLVIDIFSTLHPSASVHHATPPTEVVSKGRQRHFHLLLLGTNFQIKVWEALLSIPQGSIATYGSIADYIGMPGASRAVGSAVARNPVGYLIPCHRVIRTLGVIGRYRWGRDRKAALLGLEFALGSPEGEIG